MDITRQELWRIQMKQIQRLGRVVQLYQLIFFSYQICVFSVIKKGGGLSPSLIPESSSTQHRGEKR